MIRVLIADDSQTDIAILKSILESDPDIQVIACAHDGMEAIELVQSLKPDIVTMDIKMPKMNGYEAIESIMMNFPTPIVVISSLVNDKESDATFRALEAGALYVIPKPENIQSNDFSSIKRHMLDMIRSMAEIKVIRKRKLGRGDKSKKYVTAVHGSYKIIVLGSSVGGPQALKEILTSLPAGFPLPIVAVQHMTNGFITGFSHWLDSNVPVKIKMAEHDEALKPGIVYLAPDCTHLEVKNDNGLLRASLTIGEPVTGFLPSITVLMNSVARECGKHAIGVLLTGMGSDGAAGMLAMKQAGAHTIIQDPDSCVVFGMAGVAQSMHAVDKVVKLEKIADYLVKSVADNQK